MTMALEMNLGIITMADALEKYFATYPDDILTKVQLAHKGPFYKYAFVGNDGTHRHSLELNAQTGEIIKDKVKALKGKDQDPKRRDLKKCNVENLLPLTEINAGALKEVSVTTPLQWELDRKKDRTFWKVEITDDQGGNKHEVKIDAQDGVVLQVKRKT